MKHRTHEVDFCVIGGGMSGLCAAVAAARRGARTVLLQDRPVLGGNASSEVRMWICGAHGKDNRETGLVEEIHLDAIRRNKHSSWSVWDSILYEKARYQPNLELLLNCSATDAEVEGDRIVSVVAWQGTAETWHTIRAGLFADCSGDSILAPLTGAEFRVGREARDEYDEDIEPIEADRKTMGMSCLINARELDHPVDYEPPAWANKYLSCDDLPHRGHEILKTNYWWIELGGEYDSIHDTEHLRDELLKVSFGVWDHLKNHCSKKELAANWMLDWVGMIPGKRESRRYLGDHVLTQNDVRAEGPFEDVVAFGGWSMDDHHPGGMAWPGEPTVFHPAPSPYGIPYRSLYSKNVRNLLFAGRNISATHAAMSSTRVMATCSVIGQAVGTAAAIATLFSLTPREVYEQKLDELQQALLEDDCFLPKLARRIPELSAQAELTASEGDPVPLRNGLDRPRGEVDNGWSGEPESWVQYTFAEKQQVREVRLVFDSDLNRKGKNMPCAFPINPADHGQPAAADLLSGAPETMIRKLRVEVLKPGNRWVEAARLDDNHQRLVKLDITTTALAVRIVPESTWGASRCHLFAFDVR